MANQFQPGGGGGGGGGNVTVVAPLGSKPSAASVSVVIASDQGAVPVSGTVTTTPPANASTNLAQVGGAAVSEGQKAMAASIPMVIASDQTGFGNYNETLQTQESTTLLAANATINGATHDTGSNAGTAAKGYSRFRAFANSAQAGTLNIQQSPDGATWYITLPTAVNAASPTVVESIISLRYVRAQYVNGAVAQTGTFEFDSCLVAI